MNEDKLRWELAAIRKMPGVLSAELVRGIFNEPCIQVNIEPVKSTRSVLKRRVIRAVCLPLTSVRGPSYYSAASIRNRTPYSICLGQTLHYYISAMICQGEYAVVASLLIGFIRGNK